MHRRSFSILLSNQQWDIHISESGHFDDRNGVGALKTCSTKLHDQSLGRTRTLPAAHLFLPPLLNITTLPISTCTSHQQSHLHLSPHRLITSHRKSSSQYLLSDSSGEVVQHPGSRGPSDLAGANSAVTSLAEPSQLCRHSPIKQWISNGVKSLGKTFRQRSGKDAVALVLESRMGYRYKRGAVFEFWRVERQTADISRF